MAGPQDPVTSALRVAATGEVDGRCEGGLGAHRLSDRLRKRLDALLAADRGRPEHLRAALRELREREGVRAFSAALHALAHLEVPEGQAERLLEALLRHRAGLARALGRDPGLRVAAIDYLSNVKRLLANPAVVERAALERTERSAITDPLTGLYNRRYLERALALELRRSHRYSLRLSLLMLDLDAFKRLNDRHGHLLGDMVLRRVGQVFRRVVREADTPCRYGGEEFAVILPETDRLGGHAVAERIRAAVSRSFETKPAAGRQVEVTLSGGVACYPVDGEDAEALIARADRALYQAKRLGKNRISLHHTERRRTIRYPATSRVSLTLQAGHDPLSGRPLNLSRGGLLLATDARTEPALGPVEVGFEWTDAAGRARTSRLEGQVVRVERPGLGPDGARIAIEFDSPLSEECFAQQARRGAEPRAARSGRG